MIFLSLVLCAIVIALVWALDSYLYNKKSTDKFMKTPGPDRLPVFGNALETFVDPVTLFYLSRKTSSTFKNCYKFLAPGMNVINMYNPEDIEMVISTSRFNSKSSMYSILTPWLGEGLLVSKGSTWHSRRKIITPSFHFNILRHFSQILEENSWRLVKELEKHEGNPKTNIVPIISDYTLNSVCETAMGTKLDEESSGAGKKYKNDIAKIIDILIERISRVWLLNDLVFFLSTKDIKQRRVIKEIKAFTKAVIDERRKNHDINEVCIQGDNLEEEGVYKKKKMAMLDLLLTAEKEGLIDARGIQEEVDTFMFEGHDTTAMGLVYTLMVLANNKHCQDKIVEEIRGIFGDSERPATMSDLQEMKYLECCLKESMRLYPPVPTVSRHIDEDVQLKNCFLPAGAICHINIFDLHRRPDLFREPLEFKPERFQTDHGDSKHPYAYIPFSAGPRNCIGQKFAMLEMKSAVSVILRKFELLPVTTPHDVVFTTDLVLRPHAPIYVKFVKRR